MQERLLETDDLDLSLALKIAKIHETNIEQMKLISNTDVHYVGSRRERKPATRQRYAAPPMRRTDGARPKFRRSPDDAECSNCVRIHSACNQRCRLRYIGLRVYNRMHVSHYEYSPFWRTALYNTPCWL